MSQRIMESLGHYGFWGLSATFDFCELLDNAGALESGADEPIRILLIQPGDIRHILTTISRRRRLMASRRPIHFYLLESLVEIIGRDILLLECINDFEVPIRQRANIFLEIFGNVKVQDRTCRYIEQLGYQLRELVAHGRGRLEDLVDLSLLKYRDKDDLETVFKGYSRSVPFDIESLWDTRLRGYYKERYDSRKALADWDWHYSIKEVASIVHVKLYKDWRLRGVAFEFGDQTYTEPNRTFLSYAPGVMKTGKDKGMKKEVKGYWSDVIVSPYFTFGYDSETPNAFALGLYEIMNKDSGTEQHRHHTVEVAVYNLLSYLWEIETGSVYIMLKEHDIFSGLGSESEKKKAMHISSAEAQAQEDNHDAEKSKSDETEAHASLATTEQKIKTSEDASISGIQASEIPSEEQQMNDLAKDIRRAECIAETLDQIKIFPLIGEPVALLGKEKYANLFDTMFVSLRSAQFIKSDVANSVLKEGGIVAMETEKFLVSFTKKEKEEILKKEKELADSNGWSHLEGSPIPRRARDERDMHTDVYFYKKPLSLENSASADGVSEVVCGGGASASFSTSDVLEDKK